MSQVDFIKQVLTTILCYPLCKADLELANLDELKCVSCSEKYNIREGVIQLCQDTCSRGQSDELALRESDAEKHKGAEANEILEVVQRHHCVTVMCRKAKKFRRKFNSSHWILDVGCGTGYYWQNTNTANGQEGNLILMDFAFGNLKAAQVLLEGVEQVVFVQADAANLPIKDNSLSGIWSVQVTQHFPVKVFENFKHNIARALKNDFRIEIYNLNPGIVQVALWKLVGKNLHLKGRL